MHKARSIPAAVFVPLGGWGMSFVNKYTKMAAYDMWTVLTKRGKYNLIPTSSSSFLSHAKQETKSILDILNAYESWHIYYEEENQPLNAYLCTQRGFFNINLYSWSVLKALPAANPFLCLNLKNIYDGLIQMINTKSSDADKYKLEKLQLVCLLNLLLSDLYRITIGTGKITVPNILKNIVSKIKSFEGSSINANIVKNIFKEEERGEWDHAKRFLENYTMRMKEKEPLHYRSSPPSNEEDIAITAKLGMVFKYKVSDRVCLSLTDKGQKGKILRESVLATGQWACVFKMEYYIES